MPITLLDGILVGFTLVSAMLAMVRGFSREVLSIASWAAAAAAAFFFYKPVLPYVQPYIDNEKFAMAAAAAIVFLVALILVTLITMKIADFIIDSRIGALDRTLGFVFGAGRGLLLAVVGYLFFTALVPEKMQPAWARDSRSKPILEETGRSLLTMLPQDIDSEFIKKLLQPKTGGEPTEAPAEEPRTPPAGSPSTDPQRRTQAPGATDRQALQRVIDSNSPTGATAPAAPRP